MGVSDAIVKPFYKKHINPMRENVALLGWDNNSLFKGDLYDLSLGNWDINSKWELPKKYDAIICTRCAYFAKDPEDFIKRCYDSLNDHGLLYVDWGLGDHWRFPEFKVGWLDTKTGKQEHAYTDGNYLWSMIWNDGFSKIPECKLFEDEIKKKGYLSLKSAVEDEVPAILHTDTMSKYFSYGYDFLTVLKPYLQMYVLVSGVKK